MNRILFVDDEALILNSLKRGLSDEPYEKFFATSGEDALKVLEKYDISVLVTDMKMPGMSGLDLLKLVREPYPDLVKIVLSGYTQLPQVLVTVNQGDIFKFITKPWDLEDELKGILMESVDYYNYRIGIKKAREVLEKKNITFQNILKTYDDRILTMRDEMLFMKVMNEKLMKEIARKIQRWDQKTGNKNVLLEDIAQAEEMLLEIFQLIPTQVKRFNSKQILDDIRRFVTENKLLVHVEFGMDNRIQAQIRGKYDLILFALRKMLTLLFVESFDSQIGMVVSGVETGETEFLLSVVMEADEKWFIKGPGAEASLKWIAELMTGFGGDIVMRDIGQRKALIFSMVCDR